MESGGMTSVSKQFDVQKLDDIMALIALYRPGPMDLIGDYIKRKKGLTKIRYEHPLLEEICADTYGVMIYQEQVMAAANRLAGYSLGQSDLLRRAMGKKDKEKMAKERANFIEGCAQTNKIPEKKANAIFDLLEKFAGYGFNKSHSAAYGVISYQTAYLKAHYPVEFMAGLLSNEINNTDKISVFVGECKRMGIPILPPDMNRSGLKFTPEDVLAGHVRVSEAAPGRRSQDMQKHVPHERDPLRTGRDQERRRRRDGSRDRGAGAGRGLHFARGFLQPSRFAHRQSQDHREPGQGRRVRFSRARSRRALRLHRRNARRRRCRLIAIARPGRFRSSATCRASTIAPEDRDFAPWTRAREDCPSKRNCSVSTSPAIRSTPMRRFSPRGKYQTIASLGELADRAHASRSRARSRRSTASSRRRKANRLRSSFSKI